MRKTSTGSCLTETLTPWPCVLCSDLKLLAPHTYANAEEKYQELLDRLLAEGPRAPAGRSIAAAMAAVMPSLGLSPQVRPQMSAVSQMDVGSDLGCAKAADLQNWYW